MITNIMADAGIVQDGIWVSRTYCENTMKARVAMRTAAARYARFLGSIGRDSL